MAGARLQSRRPRYELASLGVAIAVVVLLALGGRLVDTGPRPSRSAPPITNPASTNPPPSVFASPAASGQPGSTFQPLVAEPWSGAFDPAGLAVTDRHVVVVGATGDGIGDGVLSIGSLSGSNWVTRRLGDAAFASVTATEATVMISSICPSDAAAGCLPSLVVSVDGGVSYAASSSLGVWRPEILDARSAFAISAAEPASAMALVSHDAGMHWLDQLGPCTDRSPATAEVQFVTANLGWVACTGDASTGAQAKSLFKTSDGGATWTRQSTASQADVQPAPASIPLSGQFVGIDFLASGFGWLWTDRGLWGSGDGGRSWRIVSFASPDGQYAVASAALSADKSGYVLLRDSTRQSLVLERTTDAGSHWIRLASWPLIP